MSTDRILAHADIAPAFMAALKTALSQSANPNTPPPTLVNQASKTRVEKLITSALDSGAHLLNGSPETITTATTQNEGVRMPPVILGNVHENMPVWQEENFASLASCMVVCSDEEAIRIANSSGYGLSASVFTEDLRRGFAIARRIQTG